MEWVSLGILDTPPFCPYIVLSSGVMVQVGMSFSMQVSCNDFTRWP